MHKQAMPYLTVLSLFWATNLVTSRFAVGEFDPFLYVLLRLVIATTCFIAYLAWRGKWGFGRKTVLQATLSGLLGVAIPMPSFIYALQFQSSGVTSLYISLAPVLIVVAAHYFLPDEKMTRRKAFGVALALSGTLFLALRGESGLADVGRANPLGFILVMVGLIAETINTIYVRSRMQAADPEQVTAIRLFVATAVVLIVTLFAGEFSLTGVSPTGYAALLWAALIGALGGQFLAFYVQRRFGATAFSLTAFMIPLMATAFGVLLLGEIVTTPMLIGVALIGGGLYLLR